MTILLLLVIAIGIRHAFEPDHIAAILAISTHSNSLRTTAKQGAIWGIGHMITLLIFSMMFLVLKIQTSESIFVLVEFIIGLILVMMGIDVIKKAKLFFANNTNKETDLVQNKLTDKSRLLLKTLGIGLFHGAAGSGVIIALITTTIDSIYLKFTYIALFSVGLIICMSLLSICMSIPLHRKVRFVHCRHFKVAAGIFAILIGMKMLYQSSVLINTLLI